MSIHLKFQNWKGHTHVKIYWFCNIIIRLTPISLLRKTMLIIIKTNININITYIQATVRKHRRSSIVVKFVIDNL